MPTISPKRLTDKLYENDIIASNVLWLGGNAASFDRNGLFEDFLGDANEEDVRRCLGKTATEIKEEFGTDADELSSWLCRQRKFGFLVEIHTPCPTYRQGGSGHSYSWGITRYHWLYTDDLSSEEFLNECLAFRERVHTEAKAKAGIAAKA